VPAHQQIPRWWLILMLCSLIFGWRHHFLERRREPKIALSRKMQLSRSGDRRSRGALRPKFATYLCMNPFHGQISVRSYGGPVRPDSTAVLLTRRRHHRGEILYSASEVVSAAKTRLLNSGAFLPFVIICCRGVPRKSLPARFGKCIIRDSAFKCKQST